MHSASTIAEVRSEVAALRDAGRRVALVPTMGNLHTGHLDLVAAARADGHAVVASIFVNPLQFGAGEDLDRYPRTPAADIDKLTRAGTALLFMPTVEEMYPVPLEQQTAVEVPGLSTLHCGASRPGHFRGVATVVCKLFNIVGPDAAYFGEKDFQQLQVIRRMVRDLCLPVSVHGVPTRREEDGLALSSRNGYLSREERALAPVLRRELLALADLAGGSEIPFRELEWQCERRLEAAGFEPDYVSICHRDDLLPAQRGESGLVILAAAKLGRTRLIDNVTLA